MAASTLYSVFALLLICLCASNSHGAAIDCGEKCEEQELNERRSAALVPVELYYEALCPYSVDFIVHQLYPTYQKVGSIMNITMVPYGNAHEKLNGDLYTFSCQHGTNECFGNIIHTCAIGLTQDVSLYMPFINCMMGTRGDVKNAATTCGKSSNVPIDQIMNCTTTKQGNQWEHDMAQLTAATSPHKSYVPWVVFHGQHTERIQNAADVGLLRLVCDNYHGTKPKACPTAASPVVG